MIRNRMPTFADFDRPQPSQRDVAAAWVIVLLLAVVTAVGFLLDKAATIAP